MADFYMTVVGRATETTEAIAESDAKLGAESTNEWIDGYTPRFIDFPFTNPDATFHDHLQVVKQVEPEIAVAPDIENDREPAEVYEKADQLANYADEVIIVPKSIHPKMVPDQYRVGVPTADFGSGAPWMVWDYRGCGPIHILGGGPARQLTVAEHLDVASVDTASLGKVCRFGMWDGKSIDAPESLDYKQRLRQSLNNYAEVWA